MKDYIKKTLEYYDKNWEEYAQTWNVDFISKMDFTCPNIFLSYLKKDARILDLGCGSGRDTIYFNKLGYRVTPLDASPKMCELVESLTGLKVIQMDFLDMTFEDEFDGIFACASLLHLNDEDLTHCLKLCAKALKKKGILYASFKIGEGIRIKEGRYFNDMTESKFRSIIKNIPELQVEKCWTTEQFDSHSPFFNIIMSVI